MRSEAPRAALARRSGLSIFSCTEGEDLRPLPVEVRRERLAGLIGARRPTGIAFSDHHDSDGAELFAAACRMNLEGIVAKRKGTRYTSGRCRHWLKIKNPEWLRTSGAPV
jgi:bifunctional non-homologous end joining protein LigD